MAPLQQWDALIAFMRIVRESLDTSILVFTGYGLDEIAARPDSHDLLELVNVLVAGRYNERLRLGTALRGSSNQEVMLLTDRHTHEEIEATPTSELLILSDGSIVASGVDPIYRLIPFQGVVGV
ncbi:MAG: 4Fe-4S cluster-binding domain-containing protein [Candidatus Nanopelagicales bacterium]